MIKTHSFWYESFKTIHPGMSAVQLGQVMGVKPLATGVPMTMQDYYNSDYLGYLAQKLVWTLSTQKDTVTVYCTYIRASWFPVLFTHFGAKITFLTVKDALHYLCQTPHHIA